MLQVNQLTIQHAAAHFSLVESYKVDAKLTLIVSIIWSASLIHVVSISMERIVAKLLEESQVCSWKNTENIVSKARKARNLSQI